MKLGTAQVIRANSRHLPLADNSVDLVVTSPPYFALRSYQDGGTHYQGQIGDEPTPAEFVDSLIEVTAECMRVLKPSGSLWVNLGDKYSQRVAQRKSSHQDGLFPDREDLPKDWKRDKALGLTRMPYQNIIDPESGNYVREKSLIGIPWRYALRCIDDLGLILRAEVIWSKPNGLPESVTDRVRRSHEQWFYFEQSRGEVVEPGAQGLPLCSLCGRPADSRASLVARLHELDPSVKDGNLSDEVRSNEGVQGERGLSPEQPGMVGLDGAPVPLAVPGDADLIQNPAHLLNDGQVSVVDEDAEVRAASAPVTEGNGPLSVDDASEPGEVCRCGHPFILQDEPWIPQTLAAELMQMVADGEADPQNVADFLSGDYARTHSTWFHFTLQPRYYSAVDEIREQHVAQINRPGRDTSAWTVGPPANRGLAAKSVTGEHVDFAQNPLGKLPGSVWTVPTEPLRVPDHLGIDHFAAFPTEFPKRIIAGWSPAGVCVDCGEGRRPVSVTEAVPTQSVHNGYNRRQSSAVGGGRIDSMPKRGETIITGYACACPQPTEPTTPAVVLDPFGGTGTTAMVAKALGRHGITVDMSADYCRLAEWRVNDRNQLAKVLGVEKTDAPDEAQLNLFGGDAA